MSIKTKPKKVKMPKSFPVFDEEQAFLDRENRMREEVELFKKLFLPLFDETIDKMKDFMPYKRKISELVEGYRFAVNSNNHELAARVKSKIESEIEKQLAE